MMNDDIEYYSRRAAQESELATRAQVPEVVAAHHELSMLYKDRLASLTSNDLAEPEPRRRVLSIRR